MSASKKDSLKRKPKVRKKSASPKKLTATQLPDLLPILDTFHEAYALLHIASYVLHNGDNGDKELAVTAVRQGVESLDVAIELLEEAEVPLSRVRRNGLGGAP